MKNWIYGGLIAIFAVVMVFASINGTTSTDDRARALGTRIMCPVCQGESIANSPSETAVSMMDKVEELIDQGMSDDEILAFFQARYTENIILDPPFSGKTLAVWLLPAAALGAGIWMILGRRRRDDVAVGGPES